MFLTCNFDKWKLIDELCSFSGLWLPLPQFWSYISGLRGTNMVYKMYYNPLPSCLYGLWPLVALVLYGAMIFWERFLTNNTGSKQIHKLVNHKRQASHATYYEYYAWLKSLAP